MTLQTVPVFEIPKLFAASNGVGTFSGSTIDASGEYFAIVGQALEDMTVSHVGFYLFSETGTTEVDVRIEAVGADGFPTGTLISANSNISTGSISAGVHLVALTGAASISRGTLYAIRFSWVSGSAAFRFGTGEPTGASPVIPYLAFNVGTPTIDVLTVTPNIWLGDSATTFYKIPWLCPSDNSAWTEAYNSGSSPNHRGIKFTLPFPCRVIGITCPLICAAGANFDVGIFTDAGSEVNSSLTSFDGDASDTSAANVNNALTVLLFDNPVTLSANTAYRVGIEPTTANNISLGIISWSSTDYNSAAPWDGFGQYTTEAAGVWTDTAVSKIPLISLLIDQIDDGAGSGGGAVAAGGGFAFA